MNTGSSLRKNNGTLIKGRVYDPEALRCVGWTEGDGSGHLGYYYRDYFREISEDSWVYLGKDECGIEPVFEPLPSSLTAEDMEQEMGEHA